MAVDDDVVVVVAVNLIDDDLGEVIDVSLSLLPFE